MNRVSLLFAATVCLVLLCAGMVWGQQPSPTAAQSFPRVTLPGSELRTIKSVSAGRDYDIYVHLPSDYAKEPAKKYPVLYILDGQWDFKLMDSVLGGLVYDKFVPEMLMVGITYSGDNPDYNALRAMDMTPTATPQVKGSGDAPKFLKFLKSELIPFIESNYRTDPRGRILQGHSYGGLFTLYAMLSDRGLFSAYIAGSPAVRYDNGYVFKQEAAYARSHKELPVKLFLAVGGSEDLDKPVEEFIAQLRSRNYEDLKLETRVIQGERHAGVKPELFNRGLRFVFSN